LVLAALGAAKPASAQLTACAISGEYVLAATLLSTPGPAQIGGTFDFTPPGTCAPGAIGGVAINVGLTTPGGPLQLVQLIDAYRLDGNVVTIANGLMFAAVSGVPEARSRRWP
jgi:hypothetical protein